MSLSLTVVNYLHSHISVNTDLLRVLPRHLIQRVDRSDTVRQLVLLILSYIGKCRLTFTGGHYACSLGVFGELFYVFRNCSIL
nr:MAG TPA: hypothetical protein [Caudoviricetes sp.]